ncbi:hypothetical protein AEAC466_02140 [Asticcacaulis sp. AC466]|nr:hypothetical protein AEAC466_02140 [Asticcacaulis sp. AC466]
MIYLYLLKKITPLTATLLPSLMVKFAYITGFFGRVRLKRAPAGY